MDVSLLEDRAIPRVAAVVTESDAGLTEDALKAFCRRRLAIYKTPRAIALTSEALPRTASGKVDRGTFIRRTRGG